MSQNSATYLLDAVAVTARELENTAADFAEGVNRAGSNAPGIGVATANGQAKLSDWTVLDQAGAARDPQDSQHIGASGLGSGHATTNYPLNVDSVGDINDTVKLVTLGTGWEKTAVAVTFTSGATTVAGTIINVIFSDRFDLPPAAAEFTVAALPTTGVTVSSVEQTGDNLLALTLNKAVANGDTVTLTYAEATVDNDISDFTTESITNNVPA